jgi:hypothetical protein
MRDSGGHACRREKGMFNVGASNAEFVASLCVRQGLSPVVGLVDGWNFSAGGRYLEIVRMRWSHMGATWPSTDSTQRTSGDHNS